ncbi:MAG: ABC transporter permease subunit [Clostridium fessum]
MVLYCGIISALNRGNKIDLIFCDCSCIWYKCPGLYHVCALLQHFFAVKWGLFPIAQYKGFAYTILPSIGLGILHDGISFSRIMRASMLEVVQQDYIKTARSKGISKFRVT